MQAEVQEQQQHLDKEKVNAEIAVTQAQGQADSAWPRPSRGLQDPDQGEARPTRSARAHRRWRKNQDLVELTKAEAGTASCRPR